MDKLLYILAIATLSSVITTLLLDRYALKTIQEREEIPIMNLCHLFILNPQKNLWHQPLFWLVIISPIIFSFSFGAPIWSNYEIDISSTGYDKFIEISKLPLAILALCIPLGALIAKVFSSSQAAAQIVENERKNNFELYYKHSEKFSEYLTHNLKLTPIINRVIGNNDEILSLIHLLYADIFPLSTPTKGCSLNYDNEKLLKIRNEFEKAIQFLDVLTKSNHKSVTAYNYSNLSSSLIRIMSSLALSKIYLNWEDEGYFKVKISHGNGNVLEHNISYTPFTLSDWNKQLQFCLTTFALVCKFCHTEHSLYTFKYVSDTELTTAEAENEYLIDFRKSIIADTQ